MRAINWKWIVTLAVLVAVACTPLYGLAYLTAVYLAARRIGVSRIFDTLFGNSVVQLLLLCVAIMIAGTCSWMLSVRVLPVAVLAVYAAIQYALWVSAGRRQLSTMRRIDRGDVIACGLAVVAIGLILANFYVPRPSNAATVQIFSNGFDNTAHLTLLRGVSDNDSFLYGTNESLHDKALNVLNAYAYPQGWHLSTANILGGFGVDLFNHAKPFLAVNSYLLACATWYVVTLYVFTRIAWRLTVGLAKRRLEPTAGTVGVFVVGSLLIQGLVFWGTLTFGFSPYAACIAYLLLIAAMIIERAGQSRALPLFLVSCLALTGVAQTWLLPLPVALAMVVAGFVTVWRPRVMFAVLRDGIHRWRAIWLPVVVVAVTVGAALFQVYIFKAFAADSTAAQITTDGGIFAISNTLVGVIAVVVFGVWFYGRDADRNLGDALVVATIPIILFSFAIFVFQLWSADKTTYYFVKVFGLAVCLLGIFFVPAFTSLMTRMSKGSRLPFAPVIVAAGVVTLAIIASGQNTSALNNMAQRRSLLAYDTAKVLAAYLSDRDTFTNTKIVVLRGYTFGEDNYGAYFTRSASYLTDVCTNAITVTGRQTIDDRVRTLDWCADNTTEPITVVTSDKTHDRVAALHRDDIHIVNVP